MSGILGQAAPLATTWTTLYTVPASTIAAVHVIVANRGAADATFRLAASKDGDALVDEHYISGGDQPVAGNDSGSSVKFMVSSGDIVRCYGSNANLSFTATGETRAA